MMNYFDLHCDTIYECLKTNQQLDHNDLSIDLYRGQSCSNWVQTFAFWISDDLRGEAAYQDFLRQYDFFQSQLEQNTQLRLYDGKAFSNYCNAILSVEGGAVLAGKIERIQELSKRGIRMLTLCWNGENEIAGGALSQGRFTKFGKQVVKELEQQGIIVDVSHLNEPSFWELCDFAEKPFIATHSNAKAICNHPRNLTDDQIIEIRNRKGLIGLNFYLDFLAERTPVIMQNLFQHIDYFLNLGCQDVLAIGSDFDGATVPEWLCGIETVANLYENMVEYYGRDIVNKIYFENAQNFFSH